MTTVAHRTHAMRSAEAAKVAHRTHAMRSVEAGSKARAVTDTSCSRHPGSVASTNVCGAPTMDCRALAMHRLRVLRMRCCLARAVRAAHHFAKLQAVVVRNLPPAFVALELAYDGVEALPRCVSQQVVPSWPNIVSRDYQCRLPPHGSVQIDIAAGRNNSYALPISAALSRIAAVVFQRWYVQSHRGKIPARFSFRVRVFVTWLPRMLCPSRAGL